LHPNGACRAEGADSILTNSDQRSNSEKKGRQGADTTDFTESLEETAFHAVLSSSTTGSQKLRQELERFC